MANTANAANTTNTGILFRRANKAELELNPPVEGKMIYALDTDEFGRFKDNNVVWSSMSDAAIRKYIFDFNIEAGGSGWYPENTIGQFILPFGELKIKLKMLLSIKLPTTYDKGTVYDETLLLYPSNNSIDENLNLYGTIAGHHIKLLINPDGSGSSELFIKSMDTNFLGTISIEIQKVQTGLLKRI